MTERISFHDQILKNKIKSAILMISVFIVLIILGYVIALATSPGNFFFILIIAIVFSLVYIVGSYYNADKVAIASVGAKPALQSHYAQYHNIVEGLCLASGLPKPRLYIMHSPQINAFASGRDPQHSIICVTDGALHKLSKHELEGVLAHELSHIANFDIRFMTLTAIMVGMVAIISQIFLRSLWFSSNRESKNAVFIIIGIVLAILAPILTMIVQLAISREREYGADATGVKFTRSPTGLIGALKKIGNDKPIKVNKAVAPLFLSDPLKRKFRGMFSTHPELSERIKILERM